MRWIPGGNGSERQSADTIQREGWHELGVLTVAIDDERLSWPEREIIRQLGDKLYGRREPGKAQS